MSFLRNHRVAIYIAHLECIVVVLNALLIWYNVLVKKHFIVLAIYIMLMLLLLLLLM